MMIAEIARKRVASVAPDETIAAAARRLEEQDTDVLVVTVEQRPCGLVTARQIVLAVAGRGVAPDTPIRDIMTHDTLAVEEEDFIFTAEQYMTDRRVRQLPVVDSLGRLSGLVTYEDLLLHMASERLERMRESQDRTDA